MKPPPIFVDTWGWLAYGHRRDAHHAQVKQLLAASVSRTVSKLIKFMVNCIVPQMDERETS